MLLIPQKSSGAKKAVPASFFQDYLLFRFLPLECASELDPTRFCLWSGKFCGKFFLKAEFFWRIILEHIPSLLYIGKLFDLS